MKLLASLKESKFINFKQELAQSSIYNKSSIFIITEYENLTLTIKTRYYQIMHLRNVVKLGLFVWIQVTECNCWKRLLFTDQLK